MTMRAAAGEVRSGPWAPLAAAFVLGAALGGLALALDPPAVWQADVEVGRWVQAREGGWADALARLGEVLSRPVIVRPLGLALAAGLWLAGRRAAGAALAFAVAVWLPKELIAQVVERPRPTGALLQVTEAADGYAFPSGHVTAGVTLWGTLALLAATAGWGRGPGALAVAGAAAVAVLAAGCRVYYGAHWPTDVAGALLLSGAWLALTWALYGALRTGAWGDRLSRGPSVWASWRGRGRAATEPGAQPPGGVAEGGAGEGGAAVQGGAADGRGLDRAAHG